MVASFVVVPAIPTETGAVRTGSRFYCQTAPIGFNLYDNEEKLRLKTTFQTRAEAERACRQINLERSEGLVPEQSWKLTPR